MKKRGQITPFMVIGMILLLLLSIFIYLREATTFFSPEKVIPADFVPVKRFVESCMGDLTEDAIFLASLQGGYAELPLYIDNDPFSYVSRGFRIPLWYYRRENRMPTKSEVENSIAAFVKNNLPGCLNNFEAIIEKFDITELAEPEITAAMNDESVTVKSEHKLRISNKQGTEVTDWKDFSATIQDRLGKKYRLASGLMQFENENAFLENTTMELIAASDLPNEGMEFTCSKRDFSIMDDIKPTIQFLLIANMRYITFENTDFVEAPSPYYNKLFRFSPVKDDFSELKVKLIYDRGFDLGLFVEPSSNGIVKPVNFDIPGLGNCLKIYNHKYDIVYPIVFQIIDTSEEDSYFYFGTQVVIDNSEPAREFGVRRPIIDDTIRQAEYCEDRAARMSVYAIDEYSNEKIGDVLISFQCIRFLCDIGKTNLRLTEDGLVIDPTDYLLDTEFPECGGGIIIAEKEGYMQGVKEDIDVGDIIVDGVRVEENPQIDVIMTPLKTIHYDVRVIEKSNGEQTLRALAGNESVFVSITNQDKQFRQTKIYPRENELELMLSDYTYDVDIKLIKNNNWVGGFTSKWTLTGDELFGAQRLVFFVVTDPELLARSDYKVLNDLVLNESGNFMPEFAK